MEFVGGLLLGVALLVIGWLGLNERNRQRRAATTAGLAVEAEKAQAAAVEKYNAANKAIDIGPPDAATARVLADAQAAAGPAAVELARRRERKLFKRSGN